MLVNIITIAVVIGFQNEVSNKVLGFGSHAFINSAGAASLFENEPILKKQAFLEELKSLPYLRNIQAVAYKPAMLQATKSKLKNQEIQSVLVKGVGEDYDFSFFKEHLKEGRLPHFVDGKRSDEILLSRRIAKDLNYKVGDEIKAFFVKNQPLKKVFKIVGIFETGMEDFDKKIILADIHQIQQLNDWGMQASVQVLDTLANGYLIIKGEVMGGNGNYRFDWGKGYDNYSGFTWYPSEDTTFRLIASDYWMFIDGKDEVTAIPDTAYLKVTVKSTSDLNFPIRTNPDGSVFKKYLNTDGTKFSVYTNGKVITFERTDGKGSYRNYIGAYELNFKSWDNFDRNLADLKGIINFKYADKNQDLRISGIKESQQEIFLWLAFLDINVSIIIVLMLLIGIINMGSALLVMILLRASFIGMLKAMGATNWSIRKIFLIQVGFLILKGMFWGNLIGIGLCLLQEKFKIISLNPEVYYLNAVPIELNGKAILLINLLTLLICLISMLLPSMVISRINPSKTIRFN